jgi:glycine betaine/proline transport system substrate-binding protein
MHARSNIRRPRSAWLAGTVTAALLLTACGGAVDDAGEAASDGGEEAASDDGESAEGGGDVGEGREVTIGWIPWEEDIAVTNLWQVILEENGYEVAQQQADVGPMFDGVATGEVDLFLDAWLPNTHSDYWEQYGEEVEDLGPWLDEAPLTLVVPAYVDEVETIEDLADNAELFDSRIVGIEPGSGLARITSDEVMPAYGLEDWDHVTGSTAAMLSELEAAIADEEPIVVTLWEPHPAYGRFDLKNLEDPELALGEPDEIRALARAGFSDDFPELVQAFEQFDFDAATLADLEVAVLVDAGEGNELEGARTWLDENRDHVAAWLEGTDLSI